jgi:hypothetical protein
MRKKLTYIFFLIYGFHFGQSLIWAKSVGGANEDVCNSMAIDQSGNVYSIGSFRGTVDFDPGIGSQTLTSVGNSDDIFILKLDATGGFVWAKSIGGIYTEEATSLAVDSLGNIYFTGNFQIATDFDPGPNTYTLSSSLEEIFISKLDTQGNFLWARSMGGSSLDNANSLIVDAGGNVFTSGYFSSTADFDPGVGVFTLTSVGDLDIFVSKLDASGNFIWARSMGGTSRDEGNSLCFDSNGNIYVAGYYVGLADFDPGTGVFNLNGSGNPDIFISKLTSTGDFIWAKGVGGSGYEVVYSITIDTFGNLLLTGHFNDNADFDPGLSSFNLQSAGIADLFVLKLNNSGDFLWVKQMGDLSGGTLGRAMCLDANGNIFITGAFSGQTDFDPAILDTFELNSKTEADDIFLLALDPNGNFRWAEKAGGNGMDAGSSIRISPLGEIYVAGYFHSTVDFDPGPGIINLTASPYLWTDMFVLKRGAITTDIGSFRLEKKVDVFPNPCSQRLFIRLSKEITSSRIVIYNSLGQKIKEQELSVGITEINTSEFPNGLYSYLIVSFTTRLAIGKIAIE